MVFKGKRPEELSNLYQSRTKDRRAAKKLHDAEKDRLNYFYYELNQLPNAELIALMDSKIDYLFTYDEMTDQMIIGIENPFRQIDQLQAMNAFLGKYLNTMILDIINDHNNMNAVLSYINDNHPGVVIGPQRIEGLKRLMYQIATSEDISTYSSGYKDLDDIIKDEEAGDPLRRKIHQLFQLGHPTLVSNDEKSTSLGGEIISNKKGRLIFNKSGRYGKLGENIEPIENIYINAKRLILVAKFLKDRGITQLACEVYYDPKKVRSELIPIYDLVNEVIANYLASNSINLSGMEARIANVFKDQDQIAIFYAAMKHIGDSAQNRLPIRMSQG